MRVISFFVVLFSFLIAIVFGDNMPRYMRSILGLIGVIGIFVFFSTFKDKVEIKDDKTIVNDESFDIDDYRFINSTSNGWYLEAISGDKSINVFDIKSQAKILCQYMKKGGVVVIDEEFHFVCISCIFLFLGLIGVIFKFEIIYLLWPFALFAFMYYMDEFLRVNYFKKLKENISKYCKDMEIENI